MDSIEETGGSVNPAPSETNVTMFRRPFKPTSMSGGNRGASSAAAARKPATATKKNAPSLPFVFSESQAQDGKISVRDTGPDSPGLPYQWKGSHWQRIGDAEGEGRADAWLRKNAPEAVSPQQAKNCWGSVKLRLRDGFAFPEPADKKVRIPTQSHTLCVESDGTIRAVMPRPEFGLEHCLAINLTELPVEAVYQPAGLQPNSVFAQFLLRSLPDQPVREVVQELCAQTLMPQAFGVAGWFIGDGATGKSTILELMSRVHASAKRLGLDALSSQFAMQPMLDASVVLVDEVKPKAFDEEKLKTLITQNKISVDRKHHAAVGEFRPKAKWLICSNQAPIGRDVSEGLWRRLVFVHFQNVIPEKERVTDLHDQFELREVLDWLLEGVARITKRGRLMASDELPAACRTMKEAAKTGSDSVLAWMQAEGVDLDTGARATYVPGVQVYERYVAYCEGANTPIEPGPFWRTLHERFRARGKELKASNRRVGNGKGQTRCYAITYECQASVAPAIPEAPLLLEAVKALDIATVDGLLGQGARINARVLDQSALGVALNSTALDSEVMPMVARLLSAGAQPQMAGALSDLGQGRLLRAITHSNHNAAQANRETSQLLDDLLGPSDIPDVHHTSHEGPQA